MSYDNANLKIWAYVPDWWPGQERDHILLDYGVRGLAFRLHSVITDQYLGEVRQIAYYPDSDNTDTDDRVLVEDISYTRSANGLALTQTKTVTWFNTDGTAHPTTKSWTKIYSGIEQMQEGYRRRDTNVKYTLIDVLTWLVVTETAGDVGAAEALGIPYFAGKESIVQVYKDVGDGATVQADIDGDTETWLDNSLVPLGFPGGTTIRTELRDRFEPIV